MHLFPRRSRLRWRWISSTLWIVAGVGVFGIWGFSGCGGTPSHRTVSPPSHAAAPARPRNVPAPSHSGGSTEAAGLRTRTTVLSAQALPAWRAPFAVRFVSAQVGWALAGGPPSSSGLIEWTRDGGQHWQAVSFAGIQWDAMRVANAKTITAVGNRGPQFFAARTTNGGTHWQITTDAHPPFGPGIHAIDRLQGHLLVLDADGHLWEATPTAWRAMATPNNAPIRAFRVQGATVEAILGRRQLAVTSNAGRNWRIRWTAPAGYRLVALSAQASTLWILGNAVQGSNTTNVIWVVPTAGAPVSRRMARTGPSAETWTGLQATTASTAWAWAGRCDSVLGTCAIHLYYTQDAGRRWQRRTLPQMRHPYPNPSAPPALLRGFRPAGFWGPDDGIIAVGLLPPHLALPVLWTTSDEGIRWQPLK